MSLASELAHGGHDAEAVAGKRSQFDVVADGKVIFSKQNEHRFPAHEEIVAALS